MIFKLKLIKCQIYVACFTLQCWGLIFFVISDININEFLVSKINFWYEFLCCYLFDLPKKGLEIIILRFVMLFYVANISLHISECNITTVKYIKTMTNRNKQSCMHDIMRIPPPFLYHRNQRNTGIQLLVENNQTWNLLA